MSAQGAQGSLRQRNVGKKSDSPGPVITDNEVDKLAKAAAQKTKGASREMDHKLALTFVTVLAFFTRFWGISHPNEVVFDEVHFGKVNNELESVSMPILMPWFC